MQDGNTVMSDKDKEVARCKVQGASKEIKYQDEIASVAKAMTKWGLLAMTEIIY